MATKTKQIKIEDTNLQEYILDTNKLTQPYDEGDTLRSITRSNLKKALKTKTIKYFFHNLGEPQDSVFNKVDVHVAWTATKNSIAIGCRRFRGANAKTLIAWAKKGK